MKVPKIMVEASFRSLAIAGILALLVCNALSAWWAYSPLMSAKLGLIDDHEYYLFIGHNQSLPFSNILNVLLTQTELGVWGSYGHFRPFYYLLRAIETSLFGLQAGPRYFLEISSVVIVATTITALFWWVILGLFKKRSQRTWGLLLTVLFSQVLVLLPAWADIVLRLGTSEIYATLWLAVWSVAIVAAWKHPGRIAPWMILALASLMMTGIKENFIIFLIPVWVLFITKADVITRKIAALVALAVSFLLSAVIFLGPVIHLITHSSDMYGKQRSLWSFASELVTSPYIWVIFVAFAASIFLERRQSQQSLRTYFSDRPLPFLVSNSFIVLCWEIYVYQGSSAARYAFISQLVCAVVVAATLVSFNYHVLTTGSKKKSLVFVNSFFAIVCLVFLVFWPMGASHRLGLPGRELSYRESSTHVAELTQQNQESVKFLEQELEREPNTSILIVNDNLSPELAISISRIVWHLSGRESFIHFPIDEIEQSSQSDGFISIATASDLSGSKQTCIVFNHQLPQDVSCGSVINFKH